MAKKISKIEQELFQALEFTIQYDRLYDRLRILDEQRRPADIQEHIADAADATIRNYRRFVWLMLTSGLRKKFVRALSPELRKRFLREMGAKGGRRPRRKKAKRKYPKLDAWLRVHAEGRTAGEITAQLHLMDEKTCRRAIGNSLAPSESTIIRALKSALKKSVIEAVR